MIHTYQHECITCHASDRMFTCDIRFLHAGIGSKIFSSLRFYLSMSHLCLQWGWATEAKYLRPIVVYILSISVSLKYLWNTFLLSQSTSPQEISMFSFSENIYAKMCGFSETHIQKDTYPRLIVCTYFLFTSVKHGGSGTPCFWHKL